MQWKFSHEHAPHFGGLWEAAIKILKKHFRRIVVDIKLTFEELATVLARIEVWLNCRPLTAVPEVKDGIEALTPGHFLIGRPVQALPDAPSSFQSMMMLRRWNLCQALVHLFLATMV